VVDLELDAEIARADRRQVRGAEVGAARAGVRVAGRAARGCEELRTRQCAHRQVLGGSPPRHILDHLRRQRLLGGRALPRQHAHGDDRQDGGDHRHWPGRGPSHAAAIEERQPDQQDERDRRHTNRAEEHRLRPLEDPEQVEEEVEIPVGPRHKARRAGIGRRIDLRPQDPLVGRIVNHPPRGPLPDRREPDDHGHDDEAHDRVVEHRVRVEGLPPRLDVGLVADELRPRLVDPGRFLLGDGGH